MMYNFKKSQFLFKWEPVINKSQWNFSENEMIKKYSLLVVLVMNNYYEFFLLLVTTLDDESSILITSN